MTNDDCKNSWNQLLRRWNDKRAHDALLQPPPHEEHDFSANMDWINRLNDGISHFGLHPNDFSIKLIHYDAFHIFNEQSEFMMKQSVEIMEAFSDDVLSKMWPDYDALFWNLNKSFQQFDGGELLHFTLNTQLIVDFL